MEKFLRINALMTILTWIISGSVSAQDLKILDKQIQEAITMKKYEQADQLVDLALTKVNTRLPAQQQLYGNYLAKKGDVALRQKKYEAAIDYAGKAEKILDKYQPDMISINNLITLGYALIKTGDEDNEPVAFEKFTKAEKFQAKLKTPASALTIGDRYMSLANELLKPAKPKLLDLSTAIQFYGTAAKLFEKGQNPARAKVARTQFLAVMEKIQLQEDEEDDSDDDEKDEDKEENKKIIKKPSSAVDEKSSQPALVIRNPYLALAAEVPATVYGQKSNMTEADWEKSYKDCVAQNGKISMPTAIFQQMIGKFYRTAKKNYSKAESNLVQALTILKKLDASNTTAAAVCRKELSFVYMQSAQYAKVPAVLKEAQASAAELNRLAFNIGSTEEDKEAYLSIDWGMQMAMSFTDFIQKQKQKPDTLMSQLSYNSALYLNGLLLDKARSVRAGIKERGDKKITELYQSWIVQKQLIANTPVSLRESAISKGADIGEELDEALAEKTVSNNISSVTWNQVKDHLAPNDAAVSFVRFKSFSATATSELTERPEDVLYAAMVIRPGYAFPQFVSLGNELQISQLIIKPDLYSRSEGRGFSKIAYGDSLYQFTWKPIEKLLKGVSRVYYSTEGLLNRVAYAAIPLPGTTTDTPVANQFLSGRYELHQLFSTKQLVQGIRPFRLESATSVVLIGGVDYDANQVNAKVNGVKTSPTYLQTAIQKEHLSPFVHLDATMPEVKEIHRILPRSELITGADASEKRFRQFSGRAPGIFHVATHGLYIRPEAKKSENTQDEAYMRTALALSGANNLWQPQSQPLNGEDGLLTAYEVADQDLSQTRLVVLSACETALGDVRGSEGVFGLPRAFRMAGAEKLLLSLWPVDDSVTKQLMTFFYVNLAAKQEVREAFRNAQTAVQKQYPKPTLWAPFVLIE